MDGMRWGGRRLFLFFKFCGRTSFFCFFSLSLSPCVPTLFIFLPSFQVASALFFLFFTRSLHCIFIIKSVPPHTSHTHYTLVSLPFSLALPSKNHTMTLCLHSSISPVHLLALAMSIFKSDTLSRQIRANVIYCTSTHSLQTGQPNPAQDPTEPRYYI